jgi:hypothetical protein
MLAATIIIFGPAGEQQDVQQETQTIAFAVGGIVSHSYPGDSILSSTR